MKKVREAIMYDLLEKIATLTDEEFKALREGIHNMAAARTAAKAATFLPGQLVEFKTKRATVRAKVEKISKNVMCRELYRSALFGPKEDKSKEGLRWRVHPTYLTVVRA